jgi:hypothetical protein
MASMLTSVGCITGPESLCERLPEIRSLPLKGEGRDEVYLELMQAGDTVVPCLIDRITDTTPMPDPRMAPQYAGTAVGDVAVFMLVRITGTEFQALLPQDVQADYSARGVYAYFDYVAHPEHRTELQREWRAWWTINSHKNCD